MPVGRAFFLAIKQLKAEFGSTRLVLIQETEPVLTARSRAEVEELPEEEDEELIEPE